MAQPITVDSEKVEEMLRKAPAIVTKHLNKVLDRSAIIADRELTKEAPIAVTGQLKENRVVEKNFERIIGSRQKYAYWVVKGTKPHWTSVRNLESWANLRGLNPFAVQKSIATKGTKANNYVARARRNAKPDIDRIAEAGLKDMVKEITR